MALRSGPSETMLTHNSIDQFGAPGSWSFSTGLHFSTVTYVEVEHNLIADLSEPSTRYLAVLQSAVVTVQASQAVTGGGLLFGGSPTRPFL